MAHNLGLEVIAEGVETQDQAAFLLNEQCEEAQGFLYAKPLPAADFEAYLRTRSLASPSDATEQAEMSIGSDVAFHRLAGKTSGRRKLP
jgi:predicted signal transduction protein with EAL and GGDEF domain